MMKILVIEDEDTLREDIVEWLTFEGYEALGAADGVEGVNAAILHQPDLIICDINMPRLDGYGVLLDVQSNSTMRSTPFIFLTAKANPGEIRKGMQLGADDYLTKPFNYADLLRAIEARLDKKIMQDDEKKQHVELFKEMLAHERTQRLFQSKLISMFSHEFRDSLKSVQFANGVLRDFVEHRDTVRSIDSVDRMEVYINHLIHMLDDMLLLAQMEADRFVLERTPINYEQFVQQIVQEFRILHGTTHQITFESRFSGVVMADARLLRQIATNLISNAIKYSHPGSVVRITLFDNPDTTFLVVRDQGVGIPEPKQPDVFDPFPLDSNGSDPSESRLGLAMVKQAVEAHGGTVTFESRVGQGTTFTVALPLAE